MSAKQPASGTEFYRRSSAGNCCSIQYVYCDIAAQRLDCNNTKNVIK